MQADDALPSPVTNQLAFREGVLACLNTGDEVGAMSRIDARIREDATDALANLYLSMIHGAHGRAGEAIACLERAVDSPAEPADVAMIHRIRGNLLMSVKRFDEALVAFVRSLSADAMQADLEVACGRCLISLDRFEDADAVFKSALARFTERADVAEGYASTLFHIGRVRKVVAVANEYLSKFPGSNELSEIRCFSTNFLDGVDPLAHRQMHKDHAARYEAAFAARGQWPIAQPRDANKNLRVGFLSGDFGEHACASFLQAPILHIDRRKFTPVCLSTNRHTRGFERFKDVSEWWDLAELSTDDVARGLYEAQLDILIDCAGLSGGHAMGALSPRVAPIQCNWLGYPNTTGLSTMDWRIVDGVTDPEENALHSTERLKRLPGCFLCYTPPPQLQCPPLVPRAGLHRGQANNSTNRPNLINLTDDGPIVFGSFNRMMKVQDEALCAWVRVLHEVPGSTLLIKQASLSNELKARTIREFIDAGLDESRLRFADWTSDIRSHMATYLDMDIGLDAFPYNGTTTTFEACWMGVPVIALRGGTHRARVGASINSALGLDELTASDTDQFVKVAARLANDRPRLRELQESMRARMCGPRVFELTGKPKTLAVCDPAAYARKFEAALRDMWKERCGM